MDFECNGDLVVAIEFGDDGITPTWITTGNEDGIAYFFVLVEADGEVIIEDADYKKESAEGLYWSTVDVKTYGDVTRLKVLSEPQKARIKEVLTEPLTYTDETMWCTVCQKHTWPEGYWGNCGHHRWIDEVGAWMGVGDSEHSGYDTTMPQSINAIFEAFKPWADHEALSTGFRGAIDQRDRDTALELLERVDLDDFNDGDTALAIAYLKTLDQDGTPEGWANYKKWLDKCECEVVKQG